jgi:phosphoribosyl-ATP pyrophosphohydrolase/phosphoribosyl-AMP cyclohydrolase/histidinol dehydrogenase
MTTEVLRRLPAESIPHLEREAVDPAVLEEAAAIVEAVRRGGRDALLDHARRFDDLTDDDALVRTAGDLQAALESLPGEQRAVLERTAARIGRFARSQLACLEDLRVEVPGGVAGHRLTPVQRAGCYAPGGRFPLPSSVLMTAITARTAGVRSVWVASPRPEPITLAAAAVAGADGLLAAGGAHAIAALAHGAGVVPPSDVVVGPGNKWVTAAKHLVSTRVRIDMLAGPSELLVIADRAADPGVVAADLLAQAEHDPDAVPVLVALDAHVAAAVDRELVRQLDGLPTAETARSALRNGFCVVARDLDEAISVADDLAPEHLQLCLEDPDAAATRLQSYGALFIGARAGEVLGDYGAGPNHVLPTGGTGRHSGGLSVFDFMTLRTWLRIDDAAAADELAHDAVVLARLEGLEAHARAAELRRREEGSTGG